MFMPIKSFRNISNYVDKPERACVEHYSRCYLRAPALVPDIAHFDPTPYQGTFPRFPFFDRAPRGKYSRSVE